MTSPCSIIRLALDLAASFTRSTKTKCVDYHILTNTLIFA